MQTTPTGLTIVFIGCVSEGYRSLEHLLRRGERIATVFTLRDELAARVSGAMQFEDLSSRHGIPLVKVDDINSPEYVERIRLLTPDLILVIGWTRLLGAPILRIPRYGCLGFHASLLPKYRGRAPVNWAIINGEEATGNSMILLGEGVDDGDIIAQREIRIGVEDTCGTIYDRVAETEFEMLDEVLPLIRAGRMARRKQDVTLATIMPRRRPEDGVIDWNRRARELYNWVRALTHPYPGAFTTIGSKRVFIWKASLAENIAPLAPGKASIVKGSLVVGAGHGALRLERLQVEGEVEVSGEEFALQHAPGGTCAFSTL